MGSKKSKAPAAPDYTKLAQQQADLQNQMVDKTTAANRVDQSNPMGNIKWVQDPATGRWSQTEEWSPEIMAAYQGNLALSNQQRDAAGSLISKFNELNGRDPFTGGPALPEYDPTYGNAYANDFMQSAMSRLAPQQDRDKEVMATKLRLQGLQPGTEAYDRAYKNLLTSQGDVNAKLALDAMMAGAGESRANYATQLAGQQQGFAQDLHKYLLPWETASKSASLLTGIGANNSAVPTPNFQNYLQSGQYQAPDMLGAAQQTYAQQMQRYNEEQQRKSSKGGSIGSLVGAVGGSFFGMPTLGAGIGGGIGSAFSDMRLKADVEPLSDAECYEKMKAIVPIEWRWTGSSVRDSGISAQQIEAELPQLIDRTERGLLRVNYTALFAMLLGAFRHLAAQQESSKEASDAV